MNCSTLGFPVLHYLLEFAQTHVHQVGDAIQPSHPVVPFSSCLQSFPASESFPMSWLFISCGQSIGASASVSVLPMNIQSWFPLWLTCMFSLLSKKLSRVFSSKHHNLKASFLQHSAYCMAQLSHPYMTTGKTIALTIWIFIVKVMSLLFNMQSRFVIAFLLRSKHLLLSGLQSLSYSDFGAQGKSLSLNPLFPHLFAMKWWDWM